MSFVQRPFSLDQKWSEDNINLSEQEQRELDRFDKFKKAEYDFYKSLHKKILNDDGFPKIKKTSFRMPGYR